MEKLLTPTTIGTTLDRFIHQNQSDFPFATGELSQLLRDIALAAKVTYSDVNKAGLLDIVRLVGETNIQGEEQKKLDILANTRFINALTNGQQTLAIVSEETENAIEVNRDASYIVAMDPLDGSSNIEVNVSIGSIFGIYRRKSGIGNPVEERDVLQKGSEQVAAGYVLYGSSSMLVYTTGKGVNGFTYNAMIGEFVLSHEKMQCNPEGFIYSFNDGLFDQISDKDRQFIVNCRQNGFKARYTGSLVADFHRSLLLGGLFLYPSTPPSPDGKLRLLYECNPLALLAEQAGGLASDGTRRILDIQPQKIHERSPIYIGSKNLVDKLIAKIKD